MQNTIKLAAFNARMEEVETDLQNTMQKFSALSYDVLYEFGHSEKMHDLKLKFLDLINSFTQLEESDFPEEFADEDEPTMDEMFGAPTEDEGAE